MKTHRCLTVLVAIGLIISVGPIVLSSVAAEQGHRGAGHHESADKQHTHEKMREVGSEIVVGLALHATADIAGGYNIHVITENFRFSPENIDKATDAIEGHAHLYVNGTKKSRLYGPWFHLPEAWLQPGENIVRVTLNDNQHAHWAQGGNVIAAEVRLDFGIFDGVEIEHSLTGQVKTFQVPEKSQVRLKLTASEAVELHLHGYDMLATALPQAPAVFTFHAVHAGRFAVVTHEAGDLLGREEKAVVYIEVVPE
ncbi:MAG: hypothetical protein ACR2QF_10475 [Geminicoccaceae bacterium]